MFQLLWKIFFIPSLYILEKKILVNKYKKCYKGSKSLFFRRHRNGQIFPAIVYHFQYDHRFFFGREMGKLEYARGCLYRNLSIVRKAFVLAFFKLLENKESFGKSFAFPFSAKCFDRNFNVLLNFLSCTLPFLNAMKFRRFKTH